MGINDDTNITQLSNEDLTRKLIVLTSLLIEKGLVSSEELIQREQYYKDLVDHLNKILSPSDVSKLNYMEGHCNDYDHYKNI